MLVDQTAKVNDPRIFFPIPCCFVDERYAVGSESTEQREKGFTDTLSKEFPRITLLTESEYAGTTSDQAQQTSQSLVTRYRGQFDGVFCPNETSTLGMMRALEEAGLLAGRH